MADITEPQHICKTNGASLNLDPGGGSDGDSAAAAAGAAELNMLVTSFAGGSSS
jgi:hypothetical protein